MKNSDGTCTPNVLIQKIRLSSMYGKWKTVVQDPKSCTKKKLH